MADVHRDLSKLEARVAEHKMGEEDKSYKALIKSADIRVFTQPGN